MAKLTCPVCEKVRGDHIRHCPQCQRTKIGKILLKIMLIGLLVSLVGPAVMFGLYHNKVGFHLVPDVPAQTPQRARQVRGPRTNPLVVDRVWSKWDFGYALVTYTNTSQRTFKGVVAVTCVALDISGQKINQNKRSFFVHEHGPIQPGFSGTLKVPVELFGAKMARMDCTVREQ